MTVVFLDPSVIFWSHSLCCVCCQGTLTIRLKGITNDSKDPSVDTFKSTALPILKRFGVPSEGLDLKIESRGVPPNGGGEVILSLPNVQSLMIRSSAGNSPGYGISLVAETTFGCFISADTAASHSRDEDTSSLADEKRDLMPPEDIGEGIANVLLGEIAQCGVVDSTTSG
ncbi:RNA 3-terminal phosphate cyclase, insert domain [Sesbania bispinosa]|nr:RNA 3-terminal phosphate cyclase, insert domain [Sesbania bispinosa]